MEWVAVGTRGGVSGWGASGVQPGCRSGQLQSQLLWTVPASQTTRTHLCPLVKRSTSTGSRLGGGGSGVGSGGAALPPASAFTFPPPSTLTLSSASALTTLGAAALAPFTGASAVLPLCLLLPPSWLAPAVLLTFLLGPPSSSLSEP